MDRLTSTRTALAVLGIVVWGAGIATDNAAVRLVGMGLMVVALVLRFAHRKATATPRTDDTDNS